MKKFLLFTFALSVCLTGCGGNNPGYTVSENASVSDSTVAVSENTSQVDEMPDVVDEVTYEHGREDDNINVEYLYRNDYVAYECICPSNWVVMDGRSNGEFTLVNDEYNASVTFSTNDSIIEALAFTDYEKLSFYGVDYEYVEVYNDQFLIHKETQGEYDTYVAVFCPYLPSEYDAVPENTSFMVRFNNDNSLCFSKVEEVEAALDVLFGGLNRGGEFAPLYDADCSHKLFAVNGEIKQDSRPVISFGNEELLIDDNVLVGNVVSGSFATFDITAVGSLDNQDTLKNSPMFKKLINEGVSFAENGTYSEFDETSLKFSCLLDKGVHEDVTGVKYHVYEDIEGVGSAYSLNAYLIVKEGVISGNKSANGYVYIEDTEVPRVGTSLDVREATADTVANYAFGFLQFSDDAFMAYLDWSLAYHVELIDEFEEIHLDIEKYDAEEEN